MNAPSVARFDEAQCGEAWKVRGGAGGADVTLVEATKRSVNTAYANLMVRLGPAKVVDMAKQMGIAADLQTNCAAVLGTSLISP